MFYLEFLHNMGSKLERLHTPDNKENIQAAWKRLDEDVLDYVFNIFKSQAFIDHTKEVNSVYAFIPVIVYAFNKNAENFRNLKLKKPLNGFITHKSVSDILVSYNKN